MKSNLFICLIFIVFLLTSCSSNIKTINQQQDTFLPGTDVIEPVDTNILNESDITLITKVMDTGEAGHAIVCDYGSNVIAAESLQNSFSVISSSSTRTIKRVYTSNSMEADGNQSEGRYIVIELNPGDTNATTLSFNMSSYLNKRTNFNYYLVQTQDIVTLNGCYTAFDDKVAAGNIITPIVDEFDYMIYRDSSGNEMDYRFFEPTVIAEETAYPLVVFLHGAGERGNDNELQLLGNEGALVWAYPQWQQEHPCYILAPQCSVTSSVSFYWSEEPYISMVPDLIDELESKYNIDPNRIYITGVSMGGIGTWSLIQEYPDLFAAAMPICGIGNPDEAQKVADLPIWTFHAADDTTVDVSYTRDMVDAIKECGGTNIHYTEYDSDTVKPFGHFAWIPAYQTQEALEWLFEQRKD